jgi:hypothetical protein
MQSDEILAFESVTAAALGGNTLWKPPFWIELVGSEWRVTSEYESVSETDAVIDTPMHDSILPEQAFRLAKQYALASSLPWKPAFSIDLCKDYWVIGSCQGQFGGQVAIQINHRGEVIGSSFNPK